RRSPRTSDLRSPRFPYTTLFRSRLDRAYQLAHPRGKIVCRQHRGGIDDKKQKPVILRVAARQRRAGEEPQRLDGKSKAKTLVPSSEEHTSEPHPLTHPLRRPPLV